VLSPSAVRQFYDRFGTRQDRQAFYEDRALDDLVVHAALPDAARIVEFGCGTGRFARRMLTLAPAASYAGFDVSTTMLRLARSALTAFGNRASVTQVQPGTVILPIPDQSTDRLISTYVLDLLPSADIDTFFQQAQRVLTPGGRLGLVSLTQGSSALPWFVARLWSLIHQLQPRLVGGCRPIDLTAYCDRARWDILHRRTVVQWAITSEVLVARPRAV
jgi:ubiquinone/menaquinone biosynthesis C-methylase UbiE